MSLSNPLATPLQPIPELELIGPIVLLQVQVRSLKRGERPRRWYDPDPLTAVPAIQIDPGGVTGIDAAGDPTIGDVHHRDHRASKFRGENGVSIGFTSHYGRMRDRFGVHLQTGTAGENVIVQSGRVHEEPDVAGGFVIVSHQAPVELGSVESVMPCAEFSKWCLRYPHDSLPDAAVTDALKFLFSGTRGFLATLEMTARQDDQPWPRIAVGDLVYRRRTAA
ncbi:MAG: hypothetical protein AVDCRST_MAG43-1488 [uncultured Thermomicrobiales bacterium]|uniref:MOSC domain-containing protein n=1 Tax=uncultured Thermomicrobiales bacterium TaxID=1645740 RepID=A0A6J4URV6_9BACT|nr:MAG: hypothetical protein AVDCRST_MAG43-1488 [uncultured Thermomicrobiales bacterium]